MIELSIIIPAYNEAQTLQTGKLERVAAWSATQAYPSELLVIDDGSTDATAKLAKPVATEVITITHKGKAAAILAGIAAARGKQILFTDMDQATPITEAPKLLAALQQGADVAIGSRGLVRPGAPAGRYLLSWGQISLRSLLIGLHLTDTQCGFKAMKRNTALATIDQLQRYHPTRLSALQVPSVTSGFDVEFLFVAQRLGYRICEVPVVWNYQETRRVNLLRDAWRGLMDLYTIAMADWRGRYPRSGRQRRLA